MEAKIADVTDYGQGGETITLWHMWEYDEDTGSLHLHDMWDDYSTEANARGYLDALVGSFDPVEVGA